MLVAAVKRSRSAAVDQSTLSTTAGSALAIGTAGYHHFAGFGWVDSLLNASMILTGMGPVGTLATTQAKLFASAYALFSGLIFLTLILTLLTPVVHRVLHTFHLDEEDLKKRR